MVNKIGLNPCPREAAVLAEIANRKQTSQYIICQVVMNALKEMKQGGYLPVVIREGLSEVTHELRLEW